MPAITARDGSLEFMRALAHMPFKLGTAMIELLGHMHPDRRLKSQLGKHTLPSSVGLGCGLDPFGRALRAWQRFGFGYVEVGPVSSHPTHSDDWVERNIEEGSIALPLDFSVSSDEIKQHIGATESSECQTIVRLRPEAGQPTGAVISELSMLMDELATVAVCFSFDLSSYWNQWEAEDWIQLRDNLFSKSEFTYMLCVPVDQPVNEYLEPLIEGSSDSQIAFLVDGELRSEGNRHMGRASLGASLTTLKNLRKQIGEDETIIVAGGIHQPADAKTMRLVGADFVQIDTGLIYSGPGLCKRINESILQQHSKETVELEDGATEQEPPVRHSWFWTGLLGVAMLLGSLIALWIAATDVVLPYDLEFCGLTREQLMAFNPKLLPFMSHDRVTLAGSMIALGVMYSGLSLWGSRLGQSWAKTAILVSAGVGFFSFFLFLGFDYFDPFHGFVTAVLFQLFALGVYAKLSDRQAEVWVDWVETSTWKLGQWGQLVMVIHSIGLLLAGAVICCIGVQDVLVGTDLAFLNTDYETIRSASANIIPLVAHDRATLGGMLVSAGIVYLLTILWGVGRGMRWLWHTLWWSALAAYVAAIGVHFAVGYTDWLHLFPAFLGLSILSLGMLLLRPWMHAKS